VTEELQNNEVLGDREYAAKKRGRPRKLTDAERKEHNAAAQRRFRARHPEQKAKMAAYLKTKASEPDHGANRYINYGCRCDLCKAAWNDYHKARRSKTMRVEEERLGA
jgi:hypothetical protein